MKALLVVGLLACAAFSAQASATTYAAACQSCTGGPTGSIWYAAAVDVAIDNSAQEDDFIWICKDTSPTLTQIAEYLVVSDPVVDASDIQWTSTVGSDVSCAELGIE